MKYNFIYLFFFFLSIELYAKENSAIDTLHNTLSKNMASIFSNIDKTLSRSSSEDNNTKENLFDIFFQSPKYIDQTDNSYINIQFNQTLKSKNTPSRDIRINAHIALKRTKKKFNLFMHSIQNRQLFSNSTTTPMSQESSKQEIGIDYLRQLKHNIHSKYSLGIRSLNPFIRARYYKNFTIGKWQIEPSQQFELSLRDSFKEQTNLYIDRYFEKTKLFRTTLQRETISHHRGMDYSLSFTYYQTLSTHQAFNLTQTFLGNTHYTYTSTDSRQISSPYNGIYEYVTALDYRHYIWRNWLVYDVQPALSFAKQYNYKANYILEFNFYIYFQHKR